MQYAIGLDIGGTKISGLLLHAEGTAKKVMQLPSLAKQGEKAVCQQIFRVLDEVLSCVLPGDQILGIGVGVPGAVERAEGEIIFAANLPFQKFPLKKLLEEKYQLPVCLENDANAAAWGEYCFGAGCGTKNMVYVTASTGIGAGAVLNGQLFRGSTGNAFELGHITIERNGESCGCGNQGCAELYASGSAIAKMAQAADKENSSLWGTQNLEAEQVFVAAAAGDRVAACMINKAIKDLGACISVAVTLLDPDVIVLGGGLSGGGKQVFSLVEEEIKRRCLPPVARHVQLRPSRLKNEAGLYGAAALLKEKL